MYAVKYFTFEVISNHESVRTGNSSVFYHNRWLSLKTTVVHKRGERDVVLINATLETKTNTESVAEVIFAEHP